MAKTLLKNNNMGGFALPSIKTYYKVAVVKIMCYWSKDGRNEEWNILN